MNVSVMGIGIRTQNFPQIARFLPKLQASQSLLLYVFLDKPAKKLWLIFSSFSNGNGRTNDILLDLFNIKTIYFFFVVLVANLKSKKNVLFNYGTAEFRSMRGRM